MPGKLKKVICVILSALIFIPLYILLHECGHLIVMLSAGATVTDFSILTAHVSAVGGNYTNLSDLWLHANGALLPVFASWVYMLLYKKESENSFYRIFSYFLSLIPSASLLAWVAIPVICLWSEPPVGDDVTNFLFHFSQRHHPLIVSGAALLLIAASITLMVRKGIFRNFVQTIRQP